MADLRVLVALEGDLVPGVDRNVAGHGLVQPAPEVETPLRVCDEVGIGPCQGGF